MVGQERRDERPVQRHCRARTVAFGPGSARCLGHVVGQLRRLLVGQVHEPIPLVGEEVLREGRAQRGQAGRDLLQARGVLALQGGARPDEAATGQHQDAGLLVGQVQRVAGVPKRLDPGEEVRVHDDLGGQGRHLRRQLALQRLASGVRVGGGEVVEDPRHPIEQSVGQLQRVNRIREGRRLRIRRHRAGALARRVHRLRQRGAEIGVIDGFEGRQSERRVPVLRQRVRHGGGLLRPPR